MNAYDTLISKLDAFIRKYYLNQILKGFLVILIALLVYLLSASISEYYFYLPIWLKIIIIIVFITALILTTAFWLIVPFIKMLNLKKRISHEEAAIIIGKHFKEVDDKLLNILQLKGNITQNESQQLIEASIGQKIKSISFIPLNNAIEIHRNKKYLPLLIPLLFIFAYILYATPEIFKDGTNRLIHANQYYEKPAPFTFNLVSPLKAIKDEDYNLVIMLKGEALPNNIKIKIQNEEVNLTPLGKNQFSYTFKKCSEDINFRLYAAGYNSKEYTLKVFQKPMLTNIIQNVKYPLYLKKEIESKNSIGDITIPEGSTISWHLKTKYTNLFSFSLGNNNNTILTPNNNDKIDISYQFTKDTNYTIILKNSKSGFTEKYTYNVRVIKDQYPSINLETFKDTFNGTQILINGTAGDDYGIKKIQFHYDILDESSKITSTKALLVNAPTGGVTSLFQYYFDIETVSIQPGDQLQYYFEVFDNDEINGSKSTRSETIKYSTLKKDEINRAIDESSKIINTSISRSSQQNEQIQQEFTKIQNKFLNSNQTEWQQKKQLESLLNAQEQMKNNLTQMKKRLEEQMKQTKEKNFSEDAKEKQEAIKEQLENLLDKELQSQIKKLQDLMQQLNKEQNLQQLQELQEENKLFSMDLQRIQELMKKLELQMKMENIVDKINDLNTKQNEINKQTKKNANQENLSKSQEQIKQSLKDIMGNDFKELKEMLKEKKESNVNKEEQLGKEAIEQMNKSQEQIEQGNMDQANDAQNKASQKLQEMSDALQQKAGGMNMQEIEMNIRAVRQVLSNLLRLSFDQENLISSTRNTPTSNPSYLLNIQSQNNLHKNSLLIRDSLYSLSKKIFQLATTINKETNELEKNMRITLSSLEKRSLPAALNSQQYVMTHANNLALMLNEILSNLIQQQQQGQKKQQGSSGQCSKPGGKNPKPGTGKQLSDIISGQKSLSGKLKEDENGKNENQKGNLGKGKENNSKGQGGNGNMNNGLDGNAKELMQLAQQQAAIRRQLAALKQLLNSQGNSNIAKDLQEIQEKMDKNETDIVNKNINERFHQRQSEILTRLLQAEHSLREQDEDDKRSSKNPEDMARPIPPELKDKLLNNQIITAPYQTTPIILKPFYQQMDRDYQNKIQK